jgi:hypothetical protein
MLMVSAQEKNSGFKASVKTTAGVLEMDLWNISLGLQGEYKTKSILSGYGNIQYNRMFATGEGSGSAGFGNAAVGSRVYFSPTFFAGLGVVYLFASGDGFYGDALGYNPQVGFNGKKTQITLEYIDDFEKSGGMGMISLGIGFKLGKKFKF